MRLMKWDECLYLVIVSLRLISMISNIHIDRY